MFLSFFYYFKVIVLDSEDRRVAGEHLLFLSLTLSGVFVVLKFFILIEKIGLWSSSVGGGVANY